MALTSKHKARLQGPALHAKGCITKHPDKGNFLMSAGAEAIRCHYRNQGYLECSSQAKRKHYNLDFRKGGSAERRWNKLSGGKAFTYKKAGSSSRRQITDPVREPGSWHIGMGVNFKIGYLPYNHAYHHILPWEAVKKELTIAEAQILQESGYNINSGKNMIILPREHKIACIMALASHPDNHRLYTEYAQLKINDIRMQFQEESDKHKSGQNAPGADFKKMLEAWQAEMFTRIISYGKQMARMDDPNVSDLNALYFCLLIDKQGKI